MTRRDQIDPADIRQLPAQIADVPRGRGQIGPPPAGGLLGTEDQIETAAGRVQLGHGDPQLLFGRPLRQARRKGGRAHPAAATDHA